MKGGSISRIVDSYFRTAIGITPSFVHFNEFVYLNIPKIIKKLYFTLLVSLTVYLIL
jgi:hypothetical protein